MAQSIDRVVRSEFASAHLLKEFADGFGVHSRLSTQLTEFQISIWQRI